MTNKPAETTATRSEAITPRIEPPNTPCPIRYARPKTKVDDNVNAAAKAGTTMYRYFAAGPLDFPFTRGRSDPISEIPQRLNS